MNSRKRPRVEILDYQGPYPLRMLEDARASLMNIIKSNDNTMWSRIKSKVGILPNGDRQTDSQGYGEASTEFSHAYLGDSVEAMRSSATSAIWSDDPCNSRKNNVPDRHTFDKLLSKSLEDVADKTDKTSIETNFSVLDEGENPDSSVVTIDREPTSNLPDKNACYLTIASDSDFQISRNVKVKGGSKTKDCADDSTISIDETDHSGIKGGEIKNKSYAVKSNRFKDISVTISLSSKGKEKHSVSIVGSEKSTAKASQITSTFTGTSSGGSARNKTEGKLSKKGDGDNDDDNDDYKDDAYDGLAEISDETKYMYFQNGYKCDYCNMASVSKKAVIEHMKKQCHNSASHVLMDATSNPVFVRTPEALVERTGKEVELAICPSLSCHEAFRSVSLCSEHYIQFHDAKSGPIYATAFVESQEDLIYELQAGEGIHIFQKDFALSPAETKYVERKNVSAYPCFVCSVCSWMMCSHSETVNHLKKHRTCKLLRIAVKLLWIPNKPPNRQLHSILPFPNDNLGRIASIQCKLKNVQLLKKHSTAPRSSKRQELIKTKKRLISLAKKS